jgi:hypothetical protein
MAQGQGDAEPAKVPFHSWPILFKEKKHAEYQTHFVQFFGGDFGVGGCLSCTRAQNHRSGGLTWRKIPLK